MQEIFRLTFNREYNPVDKVKCQGEQNYGQNHELCILARKLPARTIVK